MQDRNINKSRTFPLGVLFALLAFFCFLSPLKALAQPATSSKKPGPQILAAAQSQVGAPVGPDNTPTGKNMCEMWAESVLAKAGDTIPQQKGASQAWDFFRSSWQQYGPARRSRGISPRRAVEIWFSGRDRSRAAVATILMATSRSMMARVV